MLALLNFVLLLLLILTAILAIHVKDNLTAVFTLSAYSFLICLVYAELGAPDVAFTEATVGAGVSTVLFVAAILHTTKRSSD